MSSVLRPLPRDATHGSRTLTVGQTSASEAGPSNPSQQPEAGPNAPPVGVLKLRGGPIRRQKVVWAEETIDNEGMGKKKSKVCCIYHRPKAFDESSSESSDSDDGSDQISPGEKEGGLRDGDKGRGGDKGESSESDGGRGEGRARPSRSKRIHRRVRGCDHGHEPAAKANKYDSQDKEAGEKGK